MFSELRESQIRFDLSSDTFSLQMAGGYWRLRYCMFCCGQLPSDDYAERPQPDSDEEREVNSMMTQVHNWDDMTRLFGEPDEIDTYDSLTENETAIDYAISMLHERFPNS